MTTDVSCVMSDTTMIDDDELVDEVSFSEDEEAALLVALLRWRGPAA